jgi:hypothetical protein
MIRIKSRLISTHFHAKRQRFKLKKRRRPGAFCSCRFVQEQIERLALKSLEPFPFRLNRNEGSSLLY